ncbi:MAG: sigma-70 family RNA polymerase sigma factor [Alphaproteobacteria bacterium]|nr:sigma-70 family RNA polymerase sigma factor [Alphaproteobacteria bacterium]
MDDETRDHDLLRAAIDGDLTARERVLRAWMPQIIAWCNRLSGPKIDADDIFQDVIEKVITKMHTVREPAAFPGWLYQVVRSQTNRQRRKAWLRRWVPGATPEAIDVDHSPERGAGLTEVSTQVQEVLDRMPAKQREVLVLCFIEDRSQSEVAELLGVPLGTVKSRMRLARERFAREADVVSPGLADISPPTPGRFDASHGGPSWTSTTTP